MSAVALTVQLVNPGDILVAAHDCYGGTQRLLRSLSRRGHFDVRFIDLTDPASTALISELRPRMVWIETPSNPLLRITDVRATAAAGHAVGALVVVDNTFLSPALQQPISLGADVVVHSTTKYLNGHSDVVGGAVVAREAVLGDELAWWANCLGITGAPFDSYLTLRGVESLIAHPATMTHASMDAAARAGAGISDSLVRLSVGIESADDLVRDLSYALDCVAAEFAACTNVEAVAV